MTELLEQAIARLSHESAQWIEETRAQVDEAIAELDRGEGLDGESVISLLLLRQRKKQGQVRSSGSSLWNRGTLERIYPIHQSGESSFKFRHGENV